MADQTVTPREMSYDQAREALRKTAQAVAILQVLYIAVEAGEDGSINHKGGLERWNISAQTAVQCVGEARDALINCVDQSNTPDWWTPLNLLEALAAALWGMEMGLCKGRLQAPELQSMLDVTIESLVKLCEALSDEATRMKSAA